MKYKVKTILVDIIIIIIIIGVFSMIIMQYYASARTYVFNKTKVEPVFTRYANFSGLDSEYASLNISSVRLNNRSAAGIVILTYHGILANETGIVDYNMGSGGGISYNRFKDHMFALKKAGYETISTEDLYLFLRGERQLPEKSFMLTFDDGIKDSYYNADPILKLLDYNAVMFVITSEIERNNSRYYLNNDELHQMQNSGRWDIESHSYGAHGKIIVDEQGNTGSFLADKIWLINENRVETDQEYIYRIENDLQMAKELLEKEFNKTVLGFALPFGEFPRPGNTRDTIIINVGKRLYPIIFYQFNSANRNFRANFKDPKKDFYLAVRISSDYISVDSLLRQIDAAQPLDLPYIEKFDNSRRWINIWNRDSSISENGLNIINNGDAQGGMVYLDGSYIWKDYIYSGIIGKNGSDKVYILSRVQNSENYVACRYTNNSVSIVNVRNRVSTDIVQIDLTNIFPRLDPLQNLTKLSISVIEKNVGCYVNDKLMMEQDIPDIPLNGGIGLRVERLLMNKSMTFSSIRVEYPHYGS